MVFSYDGAYCLADSIVDCLSECLEAFLLASDCWWILLIEVSWIVLRGFSMSKSYYVSRVCLLCSVISMVCVDWFWSCLLRFSPSSLSTWGRCSLQLSYLALCRLLSPSFRSMLIALPRLARPGLSPILL